MKGKSSGSVGFLIRQIGDVDMGHVLGANDLGKIPAEGAVNAGKVQEVFKKIDLVQEDQQFVFLAG